VAKFRKIYNYNYEHYNNYTKKTTLKEYYNIIYKNNVIEARQRVSLYKQKYSFQYKYIKFSPNINNNNN